MGAKNGKLSETFSVHTKNARENLLDVLVVEKAVFFGNEYSGKTTLFNQLLHILHRELSTKFDDGGQRFEGVDCECYNLKNYANVVRHFLLNKILTACRIFDLGSQEMRDALDDFCVKHEFTGLEKLPAEVRSELYDVRDELEKKLNEVSKLELRKNKLENLTYFLGRFEDILKQSYFPEMGDILRSRSKTSGMLKATWIHSYFNRSRQATLPKETIELVDIGGAFSERRKWKLVAPDAAVNFFTASLADFHTNKGQETVEAFRFFLDNAYRQSENGQIIVVFTKEDLLRDSLEEKEVKEILDNAREIMLSCVEEEEVKEMLHFTSLNVLCLNDVRNKFVPMLKNVYYMDP